LSAVSFSLGNVPTLLRTPIGRIIIRHGVADRLWPLLRVLSTLYRRTLIRQTRLVAVVGSFGKTTATRALRAAVGSPWSHVDAGNSRSYLAKAVLRIRPRDRVSVLEVGISGPKQMAGYARLLQPEIVVVTSIGSEHGRALGTLEATRGEKSAMVRALAPGGLAVLNGDDPNVRWMAGQTMGRVVLCGFAPDCEIRAADYRLDWPRGSRFTLQVGGQSFPVQSRLLGRHQVYAILAGVAVAQAVGLPLEQALNRLAALAPTYGRLEPQRLAGGAWLLRDDRKATVETMETALDVLVEVPSETKLAVLGEVWDPMGSKEEIYTSIGRRVGQVVDQLIVVGEAFSWYAEGAQQAGLSVHAIAECGDVREATRVLQDRLLPGAVALISGFGAQRLNRIGLHLAGRQVRCEIPQCWTRATDCPHCPMLGRGWNGYPSIFP
jgi:UDP-N-acetylmuramoyl-tripeptide--D-alanyl-D-alanine ligase